MNAPFFMNRVLYGQSNLLDKENGLSLLKSFMLTPDNFIDMDIESEAVSEAVSIAVSIAVSEAVSEATISEATISEATISEATISEATISEATISEAIVEEPPKAEPPKAMERNTRFITRERDSIFWCVYTAVNGLTTSPSTNTMMNEKKAMSDFFNKNPTALKNINHRITLAKINELKCDLMTKPFMQGIESFIPCAIYYKRPIFVFFEEINSYFIFKDKNYVSDNDSDMDDGDIILIYANGGRYSLETCQKKTSEFIRKKITSCFFLHDCEKLLSGISSYKVDELKEYYKIVFKTQEDPALNKTEYYERLLVKCHSTIK